MVKYNFRMLFFFPQRIYGIMINEALVAVPLFIFMGVMLEKTKIAANIELEDLIKDLKFETIIDVGSYKGQFILLIE